MKLKVFLAQNNYKVKDFAEILDIDQNYLSRIMHGHAKPGKRLITDIERLSNGLVCGLPDLLNEGVSSEQVAEAREDFKRPPNALRQMTIYEMNRLIDSQN